jgi:hypothetical protein
MSIESPARPFKKGRWGSNRERQRPPLHSVERSFGGRAAAHIVIELRTLPPTFGSRAQPPKITPIPLLSREGPIRVIWFNSKVTAARENFLGTKMAIHDGTESGSQFRRAYRYAVQQWLGELVRLALADCHTSHAGGPRWCGLAGPHRRQARQQSTDPQLGY